MNWYDKYLVGWGEHVSANGKVRVGNIEVSPAKAAISSFRDGDRAIDPGTYTGLWVNKSLWMSDAPCEIRDSVDFMRNASGRVLLTGLGIGMMPRYLLTQERVTSVHVVEINADVIEVVEPLLRSYMAEHGVPDSHLCIHQGDAFRIKLEEHFDSAWHDVWPVICADNVKAMNAIKRHWCKKVARQECWAEKHVRALHRLLKRANGPVRAADLNPKQVKQLKKDMVTANLADLVSLADAHAGR